MALPLTPPEPTRAQRMREVGRPPTLDLGDTWPRRVLAMIGTACASALLIGSTSWCLAWLWVHSPR